MNVEMGKCFGWRETRLVSEERMGEWGGLYSMKKF